MTNEIQTALSQWCRYARDIANLEQIHMREAMHWRERLRAAIVAGLQLTAGQQASLKIADQRFIASATTVMPVLKYGGWLDRQPTAHYVHAYAKAVAGDA